MHVDPIWNSESGGGGVQFILDYNCKSFFFLLRIHQLN